MVLFFTHIPFVVNHTINATPPERMQQVDALIVDGSGSRRKIVSARFSKFCRLALPRLAIIRLAAATESMDS